MITEGWINSDMGAQCTLANIEYPKFENIYLL